MIMLIIIKFAMVTILFLKMPERVNSFLQGLYELLTSGPLTTERNPISCAFFS